MSAIDREDVPAGLPSEDVQQQLHRILGSRLFRRAERMKQFLSFIVQETLENRADRIKEYTVGVVVYEKPSSFDSRTDPIVRVEAGRLRAKLREYYEDEGRNDPIVISIPKSGYIPVLRQVTGAVPVAARLPGTEDAQLDAKDWYLKGRHCWNKRHPAAIAEAAECFNKALTLDADYDLAYAGLADCYASQAWLELGPAPRLWTAAQKAAESALAINPSLAQALTTIARKQACFDWNWSSSELSFRRAIALSPDYATARQSYAMFCLAPQRRLNAAAAELAKAAQLDPMSAAIRTDQATILYYRRQYQEAVEHCYRAIELDPAFPQAYLQLGLAHAAMSGFENATTVLEQARSLAGATAIGLSALTCVYLKMQNFPAAAEVASSLQEMCAGQYVSALNIARVYACLEDLETAFCCLQRAFEEQSSRLVHLKVDPAFDPIKRDPRFLALLDDIHLL